ncbi:MAG: phosphotransferase [bacterium]
MAKRKFPEDTMMKVIKEYSSSKTAGIKCKLEATNLAFQVKIDKKLYALRQFNRYMNAKDLSMQFLLAKLINTSGLKTPRPVLTRNGKEFVKVDDRLWALFPWCNGQAGGKEKLGDLKILVSTQGKWVECSTTLNSHPELKPIIKSAKKFRRRKSWAWVVPLDKVPEFAKEHPVIRKIPTGKHHKILSSLLPELQSNICEFEELLKKHRIHELPHIVTHGDFWASNIVISGKEAVILDMDCYSFEPRITDFAKAANFYYKEHSNSENASLFKEFQKYAKLSKEEIETLPLLMCAHDLYYAVGHLFLGDLPSIRAIKLEMKAAQRYKKEHGKILNIFLGKQ